jgi:hypothetical protein
LSFAIRLNARIECARSDTRGIPSYIPAQAEKFLMMPNQANRVWLLSQKFWSTTKQMPAEEIESLMERLMDFSASRDFESLEKFYFIVVGNPTLTTPRNLAR